MVVCLPQVFAQFVPTSGRQQRSAAEWITGWGSPVHW
jgi:hypothetical protein